MLRALVLSLLVFAPLTLHAQTVTSVDVGGVKVRIEVPEAYLRASEQSPEYMTHAQSMLPPANRLVETLITREDLDRQLKGLTIAGTTYQIQTLRELEGNVFSDADWAALRPVVIAQMGLIDTAAIAEETSQRASERLKAESGGNVSLKIVDTQKPVLYGSDPKSVRFSMIVPVVVERGSDKSQIEMGMACAIVVSAQRMMYFYAYKAIPAGDSGNGMAGLRSALDRFVARAQALNP